MSKQGASYAEREQCPVYTAMRVIEGRWKPMIMRRLGEGARLTGLWHGPFGRSLRCAYVTNSRSTGARSALVDVGVRHLDRSRTGAGDLEVV